jgi:hypothetical protein
VKLILTPTLKTAKNEKTRAHVYQTLAQRITQYVEPGFISDDMLRGHADEVEAKKIYTERFGPIDDMGFIVSRKLGYAIGYSPDGMVGADGLVECKSRCQKYQLQTILEHVPNRTIPAEYMLQCQTGLMVSEREWIDLISYCGGMPMACIRVYPSVEIQRAIRDATAEFELEIARLMEDYNDVLATAPRLIPTVRKTAEESPAFL